MTSSMLIPHLSFFLTTNLVRSTDGLGMSLLSAAKQSRWKEVWLIADEARDEVLQFPCL